MHEDRGRRRWLPQSRRRQAEERDERVNVNRSRVVHWAFVMENRVSIRMFRVRDPRPCTHPYLNLPTDASYLDAPFYSWVLAERSETSAVRMLGARWIFARDDTLARVAVIAETPDLEPRAADVLTYAAEAAQMDGWTEEDTRDLLGWLRDAVVAHPDSEASNAKGRFGRTLILFERVRRDTGTVLNQMSLEPTDHSLRGRPLDAEGREL